MICSGCETLIPLFSFHPLSDQLLDEDLLPLHLLDPVGDVLLRLLVLGDEDLLEGAHPPIAKYQGTGMNDRIEKVSYNENEQRIYINKDKYFEGISSEVWNYHIGGYQVLQKYLKDRKSRNMDDAPRYCRIVTALSKTIEIQEQIDVIYPELEKELVQF